ncbi:hypothetical protein NT2_05_01960 [Caenibius tardaugens NBRC 16725]|uniref:DUF3857 domain-containing protein n=2 Tax=Caenibius TaxID=2827482 RepID=U2Y7T9_9SPHN|nr:tetratricopeptide repeat protein [Caenibius tardaugens]GAD49276.1 hypothetical protein NT2_05_01960 [Caenibius tardaugens NBRC 16725]
MRFFLIGLFILAGFLPGQAMAGNEPIFEAAPDWVEQPQTPAPASDTRQAAQPVELLLFSLQTSHSGTTSTRYVETMSKIQNTEGLTAEGTVAIPWQPERSDLIVHRLEVIRDGVTHNVLAAQKFSILRRESNLEAAQLDGMLTATIQPEDLRVGDIVHLAYSVRTDAGTVDFKPEGGVNLPPGMKASLVLVREIWPDGMPMRWAASPAMGKLKVRKMKLGNELRAEFRNLDVPLLPPAAPARFSSTMFVETSSYRDWSEVSTLLAPLYVKAATLNDSSPLKAEAQRIRAAAPTPKASALAALQLVQDKIRNFASVMGEGGHIPASAEETWKRRFGECKGKTAMLLALLSELDIEAEPVLVNTLTGDGLTDRLPSARLFDHVLVHATIDGQSYWLDGTRSGDHDLEVLASSPFGYGLPIRTAGAALIALPLTPPARPLAERKITLDATAGALAPVSAQGEMVFHGDAATALNALLVRIGEAELKKGLEQHPDLLPEAVDRTIRFTATPDTQTFIIQFSGKVRLNWDKKGDPPSPRFQFSNKGILWQPDFTGRDGANAQVPFRLDFPVHTVVREEIILPGQGEGYALQGKNFDRTVAGTRIARTLSLENGRAVATSTIVRLKPEISAAEALASAAALAEIAGEMAYITAPDDLVVDNWKGSGTPRTAADFMARGYATMEERARVLSSTDFDRTLALKKEALADYDQAVALSPDSSLALSLRALALMSLGRLDEAEASVNKAHSVALVHERAFQVRGLINTRRNRPEQAILDLSRYLAKSNPTSVISLIERGRSYEKTGQFEKARADFQHALTLSPEHDRINADLARVLVRLGNTKDAIAAIDKGMQSPDGTSQSPAYILARRRGGALQMVGLKEQARASYETGLRDTDARLKQMPALSGPQLNNDTALLLFAKIKLLNALDRVPEAIAIADQALAIQPNNVLMLASRCTSLMQTSDPGQLAKARLDCDAARANGGVPISGIWYSSGLISLKAHEWGRALAEFDMAIKLEAGSAHALFGRGIAKIHNGAKDDGSADIELARSISPDVDFNFAGLGIRPEARADEAIPLVPVTRLTTRDWSRSGAPTTSEEFISRGYDRLEKWQMKNALSDFDQAVALEPGSSLAQSLRALALVRLGRLDEAETAIDKALASNPVEPRSFQVRGLLQARRGHPEKAIPDLGRNLDPGAVSAVWLFERGLAYEQIGQLEKARADLQKVVDLAPRPQVRMALARVTARLGNVAEAIAMVDTAMTGPNANSPPWATTLARAMRRGRILGMAGRVEPARAEYEKALKDIDARLKQLPPAEDGVLRGVGLRLAMAELLIRMNQPQEAVVIADQALAIMPDNVAMLTLRCKARLHIAGQLATARQDCDAALQKQPANNQALFTSGLTSLKLYDWGRAADEFDTLAKTLTTAPGPVFGRGIARLRLDQTTDGAADIEFARNLSVEIDAEFDDVGIKP